MRKLVFVGALGLAALGLPPMAWADVQLTMQGGRVTLHAKDATLRQILAEWARVGQTRIVNGERAPGGPLTLELVNVPEQEALNILLRTVSGYLAAPRPAAATTRPSVFDRILIIPTAVAPSVASAPAPPAFAQPSFGAPQQAPQVLNNEDQDDDRPTPPVTNVGNGGPGGPGGSPQSRPVFTFSPPQATSPQRMPAFAPGNFGGPTQQTAPQSEAAAPVTAVPYPGAPTIAAPVGVAVPGMPVPTPPAPQTGQPVIVVPAQPQR